MSVYEQTAAFIIFFLYFITLAYGLQTGFAGQCIVFVLSSLGVSVEDITL